MLLLNAKESGTNMMNLWLEYIGSLLLENRNKVDILFLIPIYSSRTRNQLNVKDNDTCGFICGNDGLYFIVNISRVEPLFLLAERAWAH